MSTTINELDLIDPVDLPLGSTVDGVPIGTGAGNVVGPAASTANALALFDGTTGELLKNCEITLTEEPGVGDDWIFRHPDQDVMFVVGDDVAGVSSKLRLAFNGLKTRLDARNLTDDTRGVLELSSVLGADPSVVLAVFNNATNEQARFQASLVDHETIVSYTPDQVIFSKLVLDAAQSKLFYDDGVGVVASFTGDSTQANTKWTDGTTIAEVVLTSSLTKLRFADGVIDAYIQMEEIVPFVSRTTLQSNQLMISSFYIGFHGAVPVAQAASIPNPVGGGVIDAEARTAINSLLAALKGSTGIGITA